MANPVIMPRLGNTVETCLIVSWVKAKGERVEKDEVICEVETDKATFEVESPASGTVLDIFFDEGEDVPVLTNIAVIGSPGEKYDEYIPSQVSDGIEPTPESETRQPGPENVKEPERETPIPDSPPIEADPKKIGISPRAKEQARRSGIDIRGITGTGPGGRIIERDITAALKIQNPLTPAAKALHQEGTPIPTDGSGIGGRITTDDIRQATQPSGEDDAIEEVPIKGIRKLIADRMLNSLQNSAQLTLYSQADARNLLKLRKTFKINQDDPEQKRITINDLILYTTVKTLKDNPDLNSLVKDERIIYHKNIHLGFAVDTPRGLMVPVIRNAQNLNLRHISNEARRLAAGCLEGRINPDELKGATFTVTNLGNFGIEIFTPVLNLPQTGILGVGNINLKPVQTDFGIEFIPHISFSLTIDHRVIDGAVGARFLQNMAKNMAAIDITNTI